MVLGLNWIPSRDVFVFKVVLRFIVDNQELLVKTVEEFDEALKRVKLTRRVLLSNVARIFDPAGCLSPIILKAKLLMRESWCGAVKG